MIRAGRERLNSMTTRRIRQHPGFAHVLVNGTDTDRSCLSCRRDQKTATRPVIMISGRETQVMPDYGSGQLPGGVNALAHVASGERAG